MTLFFFFFSFSHLLHIWGVDICMGLLLNFLLCFLIYLVFLWYYWVYLSFLSILFLLLLSHSVVSNSLQPHGQQYTRIFCPLRDSQEFSPAPVWNSILWHSTFFMVQLLHPYMTPGKIIALTIKEEPFQQSGVSVF